MSDVTILDGGMGKELRRIGAPFRQPEWSSLALMEAPDAVVQAHTNFVESGAEVIITNNYAVVPFHHDAAFFDENGERLVDLAGRLARQAADAADRQVLVAGSMPPLFGSYEPENFDAERAGPLYSSIAAALSPHVDLWLAETLSTVAEMDTIVAALDDLSDSESGADDGADDRPLWVSFAVAEPLDGRYLLRSGESMVDIAGAVAALDRSVAAVLVNCSSPETTGPALAELRRELDAAGLDAVRTGGYANAFPVEREDDYRANEVVFERREELTGASYADLVDGWVRDGATIVGGCCDMYPEHIAALSQRFAHRSIG